MDSIHHRGTGMPIPWWQNSNWVASGMWVLAYEDSGQISEWPSIAKGPHRRLRVGPHGWKGHPYPQAVDDRNKWYLSFSQISEFVPERFRWKNYPPLSENRYRDEIIGPWNRLGITARNMYVLNGFTFFVRHTPQKLTRMSNISADPHQKMK